MPRARTLSTLVFALALTGCGTVQVKSAAVGPSGSRGRVDSPISHQPDHLACLRAAGLAVTRPDAVDIEIGTGASVVRVHFDPTPGAAQSDQINDREQAAEVIGSALVFPGAATDTQLATIERCLAQGVKG